MKNGDNTLDADKFPKEKTFKGHIEGQSGYTLRSLENTIHPTAIIGENVKLGKGNYIGAFCIISGNTTIGENNRFEAFCIVGSEPEHKEYFGKENKGVIIGSNNHFRELITINAGCQKPTILHDHITMLRGSHIGHDSTIMSYCTISCNVLVGGHSLLGMGVNMGLGSICHQFSRIGSYCMIGMGAIIPKKIKPECFTTYVGNPARFLGKNKYQYEKFSTEEIQKITEEFNQTQL